MPLEKDAQPTASDSSSSTGKSNASPCSMPESVPDNAAANSDPARGYDEEKARGLGSPSGTSTRSPPAVVSRARRRGLFGRFAVVPEVETPYDYDNSTKWGITATVAAAAVAAPMGGSILYPALSSISEELHATPVVTNLAIATYMISMSVFPLWWSSFSEQFGRRSIYLVSFSLFVVFSVLCAVSTNIAMLIVCRVLTGGASASVQTVGAGTIADIWEPRERGRAFGIFYLGPLLGPLVAPIVGGVLAQQLGWQASMYFLAIYGAVVLVLLFFLLPETLARRGRDTPSGGEPAALSRMTTAASAKAETKKLARGLRRVLVDPLAVLLFLRFPPVLLTVLVAAVAFGALYVANVSIQQKFSEPLYSYKQLIVGLLYIPPALGYLCASLFGGKWIDSIMARAARRANRYDQDGKLIYLPEDRMAENIWLANTLYPLGLLLFGWTLQYGVVWIVPSIRSFLFGVSSMLVFATATTMLTEFVHRRSSSGVAVNNFVRNILSSIGTVVAAPWIDAVGTGWVFTAVSLFCLAAGYLGIWTLRRNAQRWRKDMDEALKDM